MLRTRKYSDGTIREEGIHNVNAAKGEKQRMKHCRQICDQSQYICCGLLLFLLTFLVLSGRLIPVTTHKSMQLMAHDTHPTETSALYEENGTTLQTQTETKDTSNIRPDTLSLTEAAMDHDHKCNPLYLILKIPIPRQIMPYLIHNFGEHGFDLQCNRDERQKLGLSTKRKMRKQRYIFLRSISKELLRNQNYHSVCLKYNPRKINEFCNGGTLSYLDMKNMNDNTGLLLSKTGINSILTTYCNRFHSNDSVCDFNLPSFDLSVPAERIEFLTKHIDCTNSKSRYNETWVFKEDADMGRGIHFYNNHKLIYQLIVSDTSEQITNCAFDPIKDENYFKKENFNYDKIDEGYVVNRNELLIQKFVSNPLLIRLNDVEHVFHMRTYFLIPSYRDPFVVLSYNKPVFMINPNQYNIEQNHQLNKSFVATNRHVMEKGHVFVDYAYDWLWGYTQLQDYLDKMYGMELFGGNYTVNKLKNDTKYLLQQIFAANSYHNKIHDFGLLYKKGGFHFDIYCLDIVINDKFELRLMEINTYCAHFCDKKKVEQKKMNGGYDWECHNYFSEATQIILEIFQKKQHNNTIENIDSAINFDVVYWEK